MRDIIENRDMLKIGFEINRRGKRNICFTYGLIGIRRYSENELTLSTHNGLIKIIGKRLKLEIINDGCGKIDGTITNVEFI